jgi:hypothetical protein
MSFPDHTSTLDTVNNLGNLCKSQGKLDEAETNTGKTFPAAISFSMAESKATFIFIFNCLMAMVFNGGVARPGVVLGDQAGGLIAALPNVLPLLCSSVTGTQPRTSRSGWQRWGIRRRREIP